MQSFTRFDPATAGAYDPGQIMVFFDNRHMKSADDKMSYFQSYFLETKFRLGWPSLLSTPDLEPSKIRLYWYTHAGNEGSRDFPLWKAYTVKEMFDSLTDEGFRPMIIGWSNENPYPMIGGSEPPPEPAKKLDPRPAKTYSGTVSGHGKAGTTPYDRVMSIIEEEDREQAKQRKKDVEDASRDKIAGSYRDVV